MAENRPERKPGEQDLVRRSRGEVERSTAGLRNRPAVLHSLLPAPGQGFGVTFGKIFKKVTSEEYPEVRKVTKLGNQDLQVINRHPDGLVKCVG